jgi:hypothetical protein
MRVVKLDWFNQSSLHNWDWKNAVSPHFLHKPTSNARGYRIKTGSKELGAGEGDHNSADQRSEVQRMEDVQAALANRYEGDSVQARAANEVQKLKCRSPSQH